MKVLILAPHTDDAELGCGGTISKLLDGGHEICWVVFSTAEDSLPKGMPKDTLRTEFLSVIKDIGLDDGHHKIYDFRVRNLHQYRQEILEELIRTKKEFQPDLVIGPSLNDLHQDHQVVALEMTRAFKTSSSILCYELPWNHITFNTQCFIRLNRGHMESKCRLLEHYRSQILGGKDYFSPDFTFGLARTRGVQCNSEFAEAFEVVRWVL